ncbi:MAG: GMP synthase (glutamine-hydrolyzing) [Paracoccaceae bacterium]|jgi:GMP synthase (glutamine-hydrolysing)
MCAVVPGLNDLLIGGFPERFEAFEAVQSLPSGCTHLLASAPCPIQMIRFGQNVYATQFHPVADAQDLRRQIRVCHGADVTVPAGILRRFVARYG